MSNELKEFEKLYNFSLNNDDIDFEITKYVDNFMEYDTSDQKDVLHQIIKNTLEYHDRKEELESELCKEQQKYDTIYKTNVILVNQLKCTERVNKTLSNFNLSTIQEKQKKRDFIKKIMKYGFLLGSASVAGFYYISKKS